MPDIVVRDRILGAGDAHGPDSLVNLYAAMPSLHVAWAAWCAVAIVAAARGRWRHLAWLYPAATTFVVLATASHFVLDAAAGLAVTVLGLLATRATTRPDATGPGPGAAGPAAAPPAPRPGAATRAGECRRRAGARGRAGGWGGGAGGGASALGARAVFVAGAPATARGWLLLGSAATLAAITAAAMAARRAGPAARWLARHAGRSRWRWRLAARLAGVARHRLGPRRGAAARASSGLSVLRPAGLLAPAFEAAGTPLPWRRLLLACAPRPPGARLG